jgi:hypothetical protein
MEEALVQPKPMEALHNNHHRKHLCQYISCKEVPSSNRSKCKIGRKKPWKMKLHKRKNCSESCRRLRGSVKNRNPS